MSRCARLATTFLGLALLATVSGCKHDRRSYSGPDVHSDATEFHWEDFVHNETFVAEYEWFTVREDAIVEVELLGFWGDFTVELYDDFGDLIFAETIKSDGGDYLTKELSLFGEPGYWTVVIAGENADGLATVAMY